MISGGPRHSKKIMPSFVYLPGRYRSLIHDHGHAPAPRHEQVTGVPEAAGYPIPTYNHWHA